MGTHVSIHHSRDDNPVVADVLAKRAPFFKVELILQLRYIDNWYVQNPLAVDHSCLTLFACAQLYTMYAARFDEAQLGYCKWLKNCKAFADLIRTVEVLLGLLITRGYYRDHCILLFLGKITECMLKSQSSST